ncbi:unnamed protein product [Ambrosiozyma monospora]|uniref:Unnamed protein product n=1 Tax=Ambrosiozyma monospora TaxID=43982 RepID=A0ACB5UC67_AMBMO|nr:unnamed protein product [Ambrosiozyma monospora]
MSSGLRSRDNSNAASAAPGSVNFGGALNSANGINGISISDDSAQLNPATVSGDLKYPVTSLSDDEVYNISKNTLPNVEYDFLDPYAFEDPLGLKFYEGLWLTQAIRNTLIYQMVFHCQPDDSVQTWSDYMAFERMKTAFMEAEKKARHEESMPVQPELPLPQTGNGNIHSNGNGSADICRNK